MCKLYYNTNQQFYNHNPITNSIKKHPYIPVTKANKMLGVSFFTLYASYINVSELRSC